MSVCPFISGLQLRLAGRRGVFLAPGPSEPCTLTWQEEGGPGGNVDLLKMFESLRVEEADGGAGGEGHPDTAASFHHVRDAHRLILVRLEALLHPEGMEGSGRLPPCRTPSPPPFPRVNCSHSL